VTHVPERLFRDRKDAGQLLAGLLEEHRGRDDVVVLALPRGGVPVAYEVATALGAPLDVFLVRKLGVPGREELAMGAIASGGVVVLNDDVIRGLGVSPEDIERVAEREGRELVRREQLYRERRPMPNVSGKTVIIVDDGLATGASMRAAIQALRRLRPLRTVVAVPAAPAPTCRELAGEVDEVVCATTPSPFFAVGASYWNFDQTADDEVRDLLRATSTSVRVTPSDAGRSEVGAIRSQLAVVGSLDADVLFDTVGDAHFVASARRRTARTSSMPLERN
jgi:predicted phosphoribosyltransferase